MIKKVRCPYCNGIKDKRARRCRNCYKKNKFKGRLGNLKSLK
jgi:hypothetical protein